MQFTSQTQCVQNQCGREEISPLPDTKKPYTKLGERRRAIRRQITRPAFALVRLLATDRVNVCRDSLQLIRLERGSTKRGHCTADILRLGHTRRDGLRDAIEATVAPHPSIFHEIGTD